MECVRTVPLQRLLTVKDEEASILQIRTRKPQQRWPWSHTYTLTVLTIPESFYTSESVTDSVLGVSSRWWIVEAASDPRGFRPLCIERVCLRRFTSFRPRETLYKQRYRSSNNPPLGPLGERRAATVGAAAAS